MFECIPEENLIEFNNNRELEEAGESCSSESLNRNQLNLTMTVC